MTLDDIQSDVEARETFNRKLKALHEEALVLYPRWTLILQHAPSGRKPFSARTRYEQIQAVITMHGEPMSLDPSASQPYGGRGQSSRDG